MNGKKIFSITLSLVMIFSVVLTASVSAALVPPPNSLVQQEKKNITHDFAASGCWDSWPGLTEGSPVANVLATGGPQSEGALQFSGGGAKGMVLLDQFGDLTNFDELTFAIKSTEQFTIKFALKDTEINQDLGSSNTATVDSTGGVWKNVSVKRSAFNGGVLTPEQVEKLKTSYDVASGKYKPLLIMYLGSQEATISNFYARWYENLQPTVKTVSTNFNDSGTPATWGQWGDGSTQPTHGYVAGQNEDGVSKAYCIVGSTGGTYAGCQLGLSSGGFSNFIGSDAFRLRYKSNKGFRFEVYEEFKGSKKTIQSNAVSVPSSNGEWRDYYINISDLDKKVGTDWQDHLHSVMDSNNLYEPCVTARFEGINFGSTGYITVGRMDALWYAKLPSIQAISFTNNGENIDHGLIPGTTNVNVTLQNAAALDYNGAVLIAALYNTETNKLVSIGAGSINVPTMDTAQKTVSVTMPPLADPENDIFKYQIKVMLWANDTDPQRQITDVMTLDAYKASGQPDNY